jgi:hypothetical protein
LPSRAGHGRLRERDPRRHCAVMLNTGLRLRP